MLLIGESSAGAPRQPRKKSAPGTPPRKRKSFHRRPGPEFGCALSFQEIADSLGCTHQNAQAAYRNGMLKLRKFHPETLGQLRALAEELAAARQARLHGMVNAPHVAAVMIGV